MLSPPCYGRRPPDCLRCFPIRYSCSGTVCLFAYLAAPQGLDFGLRWRVEIVEMRSDKLMIANAHRGEPEHISLIVFSNRRQKRSQDFTLTTQSHLPLPVLLNFAVTNSPIYKPANIPQFQFPCRTFSSSFNRTFSYYPASPLPPTRGPFLK